jgi:putative flavoprotein involved in K+ transport
VLIVGSGSSGCQIAEELLDQGRNVYLCVGRHRRIPRKYRGRDLLAWLYDIGSIDITIDTFPDRRHPPPVLLTGANGGHDVDLRALAQAGVVLAGKLTAIKDGIAYFDDSLEQNLAAADESSDAFVRAVDQHVRTSGIDAPQEVPRHVPRIPLESPRCLDLKASDVTSVVWCTGYALDFGWITIDVISDDGSPRQRRGVTSCPGLYFLGLHWMHKYTSGTLFGVGEDALYIAQHIRRRATTRSDITQMRARRSTARTRPA